MRSVRLIIGGRGPEEKGRIDCTLECEHGLSISLKLSNQKPAGEDITLCVFPQPTDRQANAEHAVDGVAKPGLLEKERRSSDIDEGQNFLRSFVGHGQLPPVNVEHYAASAAQSVQLGNEIGLGCGQMPGGGMQWHYVNFLTGERELFASAEELHAFVAKRRKAA